MSPEWVDGLARSLIQHAARNAPASLSERLEEEWLADFAGRSGRLARLRFGVGCCWATRVIAHEYLEPKIAAAGSATGSKVMTAYAQNDFSFLSFLSRRTTAVVLIIGLHAVIFYGFTTGFMRKVFIEVTPPVVFMPDVPRPREVPPPLAPPTLERTPIQIDKHVIPIDFVPDDPVVQNVSTDPVIDDPSVTSVPPPKAVNRVLGGPGKAFPNTDDYYPPAEIRMGRKGVATVQVCTDDKGRLTAAPTLAQTSGSAGLDEGALKLAKAGSGHYRATTEDGRSVSSCYPFRIKFDFKN
jgi:TonB family protein